jgi:hypothetical protein
VYENAHRVSEDVTLQYKESKSINKDMENHLCLNHSKQRPRSSKLMFSIPNPLSYIWQERERDVQVLDLKGLVDKYLGTQNLDTTQMYSTYHEG